MIMSGWDTIAHTQGLQNLSFVDNPDLNIELRLASSVSFALVARHQLPHVGFITSLFSRLLAILVKSLESSKRVFFMLHTGTERTAGLIMKINGKALKFDLEKGNFNLHSFLVAALD